MILTITITITVTKRGRKSLQANTTNKQLLQNTIEKGCIKCAKGEEEEEGGGWGGGEV